MPMRSRGTTLQARHGRLNSLFEVALHLPTLQEEYVKEIAEEQEAQDAADLAAEQVSSSSALLLSSLELGDTKV